MAKETYHTHQRDAVGRVLEERQRGMRMRKCQGLLGLFCVYNRSLLPYGRPLLTYCTHKRDAVGRVLQERQRGMHMRKCQKRPTIWQKRPIICTKETYRYTGIPGRATASPFAYPLRIRAGSS